MEIGKIIKKFRKEKGLTQKQLGKACGIDEANIRKYENGKQTPRIENLEKIANAMGMSASDLIMSQMADLLPDIEIADPPVFAPKKEDEIIGYYIQLNEEGQKKATEYVKDLTKIDAYRKPDDECPF